MQWNNQGETNRRTTKLKGGGQDTPTMVAKEQAQKVTQQETIINIDDIGTHKELIEGVEQVVEHTQEQNQQGKITPLFEISILQENVEVEGHT